MYTTLTDPTASAGYHAALLSGLQLFERILTWKVGPHQLLMTDKLRHRYLQLLGEASIMLPTPSELLEGFQAGIKHGREFLATLIDECLPAGTHLTAETTRWMSCRIQLRHLTEEEYARLRISNRVVYAVGINDSALIAGAEMYAITNRPDVQIYLRELHYKGSRGAGNSGDIIITDKRHLYVPAYYGPQFSVTS